MDEQLKQIREEKHREFLRITQNNEKILEEILEETVAAPNPLGLLFSSTVAGIDVALSIFSMLPDKDKIALSKVCKFAHELMVRTKIKKTVNLNKIFKSAHYDRFTHIIATSQMLYDMKRLGLKLPQCLTDLRLYDYKGYLQTLTRDCKHLVHLTLERSCTITVNNHCLPVGLTHLTWRIRQPLPKVLPSGLVNLRLENYQPANHKGYKGGMPLLPNLPESLTYLSIDQACVVHITNGSIPQSVKVLRLNCKRITFDPNLRTEVEKLIIDEKASGFTVARQIHSSNLKTLIVAKKYLNLASAYF